MYYNLAILGSMGPLATAKAFEQLILLTNAKNDNEHIPVIVLGDTAIPDRTKAICGTGESPVSELVENFHIVDKLGINYIFIPCNTCHYYYDELQEYTSAKIINMVEITAQYVRRKYKDLDCYVLGTNGTKQGKIYEKYLSEYKCYRELSDAEQSFIMNSIYKIKESGVSDDIISELKNFIINKANSRKTIFILGCTELSILNEFLLEQISNVILIDSMEVAICSTIKQLGYEIKQDKTSIDLSLV